MKVNKEESEKRVKRRTILDFVTFIQNLNLV